MESRFFAAVTNHLTFPSQKGHRCHNEGYKRHNKGPFLLHNHHNKSSLRATLRAHRSRLKKDNNYDDVAPLRKQQGWICGATFRGLNFPPFWWVLRNRWLWQHLCGRSRSRGAPAVFPRQSGLWRLRGGEREHGKRKGSCGANTKRIKLCCEFGLSLINLTVRVVWSVYVNCLTRLRHIVTCIGPNQKNQPNLDLYLVQRYKICHFPIVVSYLCIGQSLKNQPNLVLYLVQRSKIFVSVATLVVW